MHASVCVLCLEGADLSKEERANGRIGEFCVETFVYRGEQGTTTNFSSSLGLSVRRLLHTQKNTPWLFLLFGFLYLYHECVWKKAAAFMLILWLAPSVSERLLRASFVVVFFIHCALGIFFIVSKECNLATVNWKVPFEKWQQCKRIRTSGKNV